MSKRTQTLLARHGNDFFKRIGAKGFQSTCDRYFGGDRERMKRWLTDMGQWVTYSGLSYHKPAIEHYPGAHPAEVARQAAWLDYVRAAIEPDFAPIQETMGDDT